MNILIAQWKDDSKIQKIAKQSKFTRDFCSILFVRQNIRAWYKEGVVGKAVNAKGEILGFICAKHLIRKPHTTIYYMGVALEHRGKGVGKRLLQWALKQSPWGKLQLVCEEGNAEGSKFYDALGFQVVDRGVVGKAERPYRRMELKR